jgi:hypothetical protein
MTRLVLPEMMRERVEAYVVRDEGLEAIEVRKQALQAEFERAQELYLSGDIGRNRYDRARGAFQRAMAELRLKRYAGSEFVQPLLDDFPMLWRKVLPLERKGLLSTVFREVRVRDGQIVDWKAAPPFDQLLGQESA